MIHRVRSHTSTPTSIRIPDDVVEDLRSESLQRNVTVSFLVVSLLREWKRRRDEERKRET